MPPSLVPPRTPESLGGRDDRNDARLSSVVSPQQAFWSTLSVWDGNLILWDKSMDYKVEQREFWR